MTVKLQARALREHEPPLWVRAGSGKRSVPVDVAHLVNLVIATATGFPADAPENVLRYRALMAEDDESPLGYDFGQYLDRFVDRLARDLHGSMRVRLGVDETWVDLMLGEAPMAGVRRNPSIPNANDGFQVTFMPPQADLLLRTEASNSKTRLIERVTISLELLEVLAGLWRDSIAHSPENFSPLDAPPPYANTNTEPPEADTGSGTVDTSAATTPETTKAGGAPPPPASVNSVRSTSPSKANPTSPTSEGYRLSLTKKSSEMQGGYSEKESPRDQPQTPPNNRPGSQFERRGALPAHAAPT